MKTIKVSEASGAALDWLVEKCEGALGEKPTTCRDCKHHEERAITDSSEHICHMSFMTWTSGGYVDDTPFGDGISVDYGTHQNCPITELSAEKYSTDWSLGGPIIERENIAIMHWLECGWQADKWNFKFVDGHSGGPTPLIAAMRCYVTSKLGETVEVPDELV